MLTLEKQPASHMWSGGNTPPMQRPGSEARILHCDTAEVVRSNPGGAVSATRLKEKNLRAVRDVHVDFAGGGQWTSFSQGP